MWEAIRQNSDLIVVAANVAMVPIWLTYLHLFWSSYRRQLRASLIIHPGAGTGLRAQCLISNMSAEAIHIEGIILRLTDGEACWSTAITATGETDREDPPRGPAAGIGWHEGPLASGGYVNIGRFQELVERAFGSASSDENAPDRLGFDGFEIWVIADYSAEQTLVFARRGFRVGHREGQWVLRPERMRTETLRGGRRQRQIKQDLQEQLERALMPAGQQGGKRPG